MVLAGGTMVSGGGMLDESLTTSLEQLVIDNETISIFRRVIAETEVNEDTLALDALPEALAAGTFLSEEHTVRHLRAGALWLADLFTPVSYEAWEQTGRPDLFEKAHERVEQLLGEWEPISLPTGVEAEVEKVMAEMQREFAARAAD